MCLLLLHYDVGFMIESESGTNDIFLSIVLFSVSYCLFLAILSVECKYLQHELLVTLFLLSLLSDSSGPTRRWCCDELKIHVVQQKLRGFSIYRS